MVHRHDRDHRIAQKILGNLSQRTMSGFLGS
jgi:hypothetical protein